MSEEGKQVIAKLASQLAPTQQNKIVVNGYTDNAPIGRELARKGISSNEILSQSVLKTWWNFCSRKAWHPSWFRHAALATRVRLLPIVQHRAERRIVVSS
jgi:hypothetical protein